jgi:hypothetical protein
MPGLQSDCRATARSVGLTNTGCGAGRQTKTGFELSPRLGTNVVAFGLHAIAQGSIVELSTSVLRRRLEG